MKIKKVRIRYKAKTTAAKINSILSEDKPPRIRTAA